MGENYNLFYIDMAMQDVASHWFLTPQKFKIQLPWAFLQDCGFFNLFCKLMILNFSFWLVYLLFK